MLRDVTRVKIYLKIQVEPGYYPFGIESMSINSYTLYILFNNEVTNGAAYISAVGRALVFSFF